MSELNDTPPDSRSEVARGAGIAFLGRMGAILEPVGFIVFAALYGVEAFGLFATLIAYSRTGHEISKFGMHNALQRFVPAQADEAAKHAVVRNALILSTGLGLAIGLATSLAAPWAVNLINADAEALAALEGIIRVYAWSIPLWAFLEVSMAAIRARKVFGPDIRVRIFYEQGLRLGAGVLFFYFGWLHYGLVLAHVGSLAIACLIAIRLLSRHYQLRLILAPGRGATGTSIREMTKFGSAMSFNNMGKELLSNLPIMVLNALIPGAAGASAAGVYSIARRIVSALQSIRMSFSYVMAPITAEHSHRASHDELRSVFTFSTRLLWSFFLPVAGTMIVLREEVLGIVGPDFVAGAGVIVALVIGRGFEAGTGPSSTVIEMIGRYRLLILNAVIGVGLTAWLLFTLVPEMGLLGAGIAGASGLAAVHLAALIQVIAIYKISPFDRALVRPIIVASVATGLIVAVAMALAPLGAVVKFVGGVVAMLLSLAAVPLLGLPAHDLEVIDPKGRLRRFRTPFVRSS